MRNRLLAIVGPTGVGKNALALTLAKKNAGEIVNADSRQVYRDLDIGTAKPSKTDRSAVPHHLFDVVDPADGYSLALFLREASTAIHDIHERGKLPIIAGGTGQWVWALLEGWHVPEVPPNPELRRRLEERAGSEGYASLHAELSRLDPAAAARIDARNVRRVIRAIEVAGARSDAGSGTERTRKSPPPFDTRLIGLTLDRESLYRRIDRRVERMIEAGWVDEVRRLLAKGYSPGLPSLSSLGYQEIVRHLAEDVPMACTMQQIKYKTHGFARSQYAWFRLADQRIRWFDAGSQLDEAEAWVAQWLDASKTFNGPSEGRKQRQ